MAAVDSFQLLYREISRSCSSYFETLALVGALYMTSKAVILLRDCCTLVRVHFLPRMIPSKKLTQRYGDWAVIYGKDAAGVKTMRMRHFVGLCHRRQRRVRSMHFIGVNLSLSAKQ